MNFFNKKKSDKKPEHLTPEQKRRRDLEIYFAQNGPFGFDMSAIGFYNWAKANGYIK